MLNYQLAKQLKEEGFPQSLADGSTYFYTSDGKLLSGSTPFSSVLDTYKLPILSELIAACIRPDYEFTLAESHADKYCPYHWEASYEDWSKYREPGDEVVKWVSGQTPEEAVANLYLALNKKNTGENFNPKDWNIK